jgi:hypothetical protein
VFLREQYYWFWLGQYCRYWELQFRLLNGTLNDGDNLAPPRRRMRPSPTYMRLVVDNTGR